MTATGGSAETEQGGGVDLDILWQSGDPETRTTLRRRLEAEAYGAVERSETAGGGDGAETSYGATKGGAVGRLRSGDSAGPATQQAAGAVR